MSVLVIFHSWAVVGEYPNGSMLQELWGPDISSAGEVETDGARRRSWTARAAAIEAYRRPKAIVDAWTHRRQTLPT
jgi:hypothetical protein